MSPKDMDIKKPVREPKISSLETQPDSKKLPKKSGSKGKRLTILALIFLLMATIIIVGSYFFVRDEIRTPLDSSKTEEKLVEIEEGQSTKGIAKKLEDEGIIKNQFYFLLYVFKTGTADQLQAGNYYLLPSMSIPRIVQKIVLGDTVPDEIGITIPEGFRLSEIESRINSEFNKINNKGNQIKISGFKVDNFDEKYSFLEGAPENYNLEGYLFPDTYKFPNFKDMTDEEKSLEIVKKMLENFNTKLNRGLKEDIKTQKKTIFEIITMASILEKEVKTKEDREIVSGIFWKRIKEGRALESCATIAYILGKDKWRYSFEDTRIDSPYNTYLNKGLPKAPISNPGIDSIEAAIYPKDSKYNYFLSDPKTGKTIFSVTLEEHNQNKLKYLK